MGVGVLLAPDGHLAARLRHDPSAKLNNEAGFLGHRDETARGQDPSLGMVPPYECLDGEQPPGAEVDLGLVVQQEATVVNCVAEEQLSIRALFYGIPESLVEDNGLVPASGLGQVKGGVGLPEEILGTGRAGSSECNAEASRAGDVMTADFDRLCEQVQKPLGDRWYLVLVGRPPEKQDELIACQTSDEIPGAHPVAQTLGDGHEQAVTSSVAQEIVHSLEPVQVQQKQRCRLTVMFGQFPVDLVQ
jgi:hypothetical protein